MSAKSAKDLPDVRRLTFQSISFRYAWTRLLKNPRLKLLARAGHVQNGSPRNGPTVTNQSASPEKQVPTWLRKNWEILKIWGGMRVWLNFLWKYGREYVTENCNLPNKKQVFSLSSGEYVIELNFTPWRSPAPWSIMRIERRRPNGGTFLWSCPEAKGFQDL